MTKMKKVWLCMALVAVLIVCTGCGNLFNKISGTYVPSCAYQVSDAGKELVLPDSQSTINSSGVRKAIFNEDGTGYFVCVDGVNREFTWENGILTSRQMATTMKYEVDGNEIILIPQTYKSMPQYMELHLMKSN